MYLDDIPLMSHQPPRRRRYLALYLVPAAVLVLVLAVVAGEFFGVFAPSGDPKARAPFGGSVTVRLDAGTAQVVYVDSLSTADVRCRLASHSDSAISFDRVLVPFGLRAPAGDWYAARWVRVEVSGTYQIRCDGDGTGFGVAPDTRLTRFVDQRVFLFGVPAGAIVCGVLVTIALRRLRGNRVD